MYNTLKEVLIEKGIKLSDLTTVKDIWETAERLSKTLAPSGSLYQGESDKKLVFRRQLLIEIAEQKTRNAPEFVFNDDLEEQLLKTEPPKKGAFMEFLPFKSFKVVAKDISILATKVPQEDVYVIIVNSTQGTKFEVNGMPCMASVIPYTADITDDLYALNLMAYLSTESPDLVEIKPLWRDKNKKKKGATKPRKEPKRYNVGSRWGAAFRKWKLQTEQKDPTYKGTGASKCPHTRRAHWHSFWTGKRDSKERKLVSRWLCEMTINWQKGEEVPVKIKVK